MVYFKENQYWAANSSPWIYRWYLPVFPGMANRVQVANNGKAAKILLFTVKCSS